MSTDGAARRRVLLRGILAVGLLGVSAAAWAAASTSRTPAQRAAAATPPTRSLVTAPVTNEQLVDELRLEGRLSRAESVTITGSAAGAPGVTRQVVTRMPVKAGDQVDTGTILAEVVGRPVIALPGEFFAYRDLTTGHTGPDVTQLQKALRPLYGTPVTSVFDDRTDVDVRKLYRAVGYPPPLAPAASPAAPGVPAPPPPAVLLPAREVAFVAHLPATVGDVKAAVNGDGAGPLVSLVGGSWQVVVAATPEMERTLGALRSDVKIVGGAGPGQNLTAKLSIIRAVAGTGPQTGGTDRPGAAETPRAREAVFVLDGPVAGLLGAGQSVLIQRSVSPQGALVVPIAALWTGPGGGTTVTVVAGDTQRRVTVTVALVVNGKAAVSTTTGLQTGDQVLVGSQAGGATGD